MPNEIQTATSSALISEEQQFQEVLGIIQLHCQTAAKAVNEEALLTYWHVGAYVSAKLQNEEWGSAVVTRLSEYLRTQDPTLKGYGRRNIYNMVLFYDSYSSPAFKQLLLRIGQAETLQLTDNAQEQLPQIVQNNSAQLSTTTDQFVQNDSAQMPKILTLTIISNHLEILTRRKSPEERLFYILYSHRERLKYKELQRVITNDAYGSLVGGDKTNLSLALKEQYPNSPLQLRDTIYIDLLGLPQKFKETRLRKAMVDHMKHFILELGKDFLFMEEEYAQIALDDIKPNTPE